MIAHVRKLDRALEAFAGSLFDGMGRPERRRAMAWYVEGLLLDGIRKSIEPMAARLVDEASGVEALVLDDTGFPKQGKHSVGVARQYSGTLGRTANCQVAVSLHLAGELGSSCLGMQLYLPEEWTSDSQRCRAAGVPKDVGFLRKWEIALQLLDDAARWGVAKRLLLVDAGYGEITEFRQAITERGYPYIVGMGGDPVAWMPGTAPVAPGTWRRPPGQSGPARTRYRDGKHSPVSLLELAKALGTEGCRSIRWREGAKGTQKSRFGAARVRTAHKHRQGRAPGPEEWLLYEWPSGEPEPTKFWLSNLPASTPLKELVRLAKLRWRVERDYQELKEEIGLDHFEGRSWRGFHHHVTLCAAAHAFLALNRALSPPNGNKVDTADGPQAAPDRSPSQDRMVSALSSASRRINTASGSVKDVIE